MTDRVLGAEDLIVDRGNHRVLDGISLAVEPGDRLLIQGRSGAGKTTLFEVLALLAEPDAGRVIVDGRYTDTCSRTERAKLRRETIGLVFQEFRLIPELTTWENTALPQDHTGDRDDAWLDHLHTALNLTDVTDQYPPSLSGGEKQRVAIARALANRPRVVLADEPTGQLDPDTTDAVLDLLLSIQEETGTALVVVSHDDRLAPAFDAVAHLENGVLTPDN